MVLYIIGYTIQLITFLYTLVLLARMAISWLEVFSPQWRPRGILLVLVNFIWALTEPPLRWFRKRIPPLRLGAIALDVGFLVLFMLVLLLGRFATFLM